MSCILSPDSKKVGTDDVKTPFHENLNDEVHALEEAIFPVAILQHVNQWFLNYGPGPKFGPRRVFLGPRGPWRPNALH